MPQFTVDDDLAALVERLAKPKPFENLSFSAALRRVLQDHVLATTQEERSSDLEKLLADSTPATKREPKKTPSPSVTQWVTSVPELKSRRALNTWKAVCDFLMIDTAGDSARRKLKNWVRINRTSWPAVPDIE
jgi:hypothetical protein